MGNAFDKCYECLDQSLPPIVFYRLSDLKRLERFPRSVSIPSPSQYRYVIIKFLFRLARLEWIGRPKI